jgi:integrase
VSNLRIGRLQGRFCVTWDRPDGKRARYRLDARTAAEAEAEAIEVYRREQPKPVEPTVEQIWEPYRVSLEGRPTATTLVHVGKAVLKRFGALKPMQITDAMCEEYANRRYQDGVSRGTVWTELGHLNSALHWAVKQRIIPACPHIWRPQKPAPKERSFTREEIGRLLAVPDTPPHIRLAVLLMLSTAGRVTAILELTWDRVDLERRQINLRKETQTTRKGRAIVPINQGLYDALVAAQKAALSDYVVEWAGNPIKSIRKGLQSLGEKANVAGVTAHVFRHTAAVHMAEAGIPMSEISQYLGHSNTSITERIYARYSPGHLRKAAAALDFTVPQKETSNDENRPDQPPRLQDHQGQEGQ